MLTSNNDIILLKDNILSNSLEIVLISVTLSNGQDKMYGKGTLRQDNDGKLILNFFSNTIIDNTERLGLIIGNINSGNLEGYIMPMSDYWSMTGEDINQKKYKCSRMYSHYPRDNYSTFYLYDKVFSDQPVTSSRIVCFGHYHIPKSEQFQTQTKWHDLYFTDISNYFTVELTEEISLRIVDYQSYVDIVVIHSDKIKIDIETVWNIIQTLNFVFGIDLNIGFVQISKIGLWLYSCPKKEENRSSFTAPLSDGRSYSSDFFIHHKLLIKKYFTYICKDTQQQLPIIQKRIWSAGQSFLYVLSVVLSTQIESICKFYYNKYYQFDQSKLGIIRKALSIIGEAKNLNTKERELVCNILNNSLPKEAQSKQELNPKNILQQLKKENIISDTQFIQRWNSLRCFTAHGDKLETNAKDNDKMAKDIYICTNLYYELVFGLIGYMGIYSYKEYDSNKLKFYFPYQLKNFAINNGDKIEYNGKKIIKVIDAEKNSVNYEGSNMDFLEWLNTIINTHTDYNPLSKIKHNGNLIDFNIIPK